MPNDGAIFRDNLIYEIKSWKLPELHIYKEPYVGSRFVGKKRKLDIVLEYKGKTLGIEAKLQQGPGTAYQKLSYTINDALITPIPTIIVFCGGGIEQDLKAQLLSSGIGVEVEWSPEKSFSAGSDILKQRVLIELGLDWLSDQEGKKVE